MIDEALSVDDQSLDDMYGMYGMYIGYMPEVSTVGDKLGRLMQVSYIR